MFTWPATHMMTLAGSKLLMITIMDVSTISSACCIYIPLLSSVVAGKMEIQQAGAVKSILDTVVSELAQDQKRKFSYTEMAFFAKWWSIQNDTVKQTVCQTILGLVL